MKKNILLLSALFLTIFQQSNAQCTASITNVPHGDCANTDIELMASGAGTINGFTYQWTGPNGFTSSAQTAYIYYAQESASGYYKVIITDPLGCTAVDSTAVIKHPVPIVYTGGQAGGCEGTTTNISAQDFSGNYGPYTYMWDNGSTTQTIAVSHNGGIYPAPACFMTNMYGCTAANNTTFLIYTFPAPAKPVIEALSATSFCKGGSVTLTTPNDPNLSYQWKKPAAIITGATNSDFTTAILGRYSLIASNSMSCTSVSNTIQVTVFSNPQIQINITGSLNICNGDSVILQANQESGSSYQWKKNNIDINSATASSLVVKKKGYYRLMVTNQNGCTRISPAFIATSNCRSDYDRISDETALSVYPNPSNNFFNLSIGLNEEEENVQLIITDVTGRQISENTIQTNAADFQFGENLPAGIYNVTVVKKNSIQAVRIIKTE